MDVKLPYAYKNGILVTIDEVENGLKCDCICPVCSEKLIARKGNEKIHHFAHYNNSHCNGALETILHILCKEILAQSKHFVVPALYFDYNRRYEIFPEYAVPIDSIWLEKKFYTIIPDIIIKHKERLLVVEVTVHHGVTDQKRKLLKISNTPGVEIYAKNLIPYLYHQKDFRLTNRDFQKELISGIKFKYWVYNPKLNKLQSTLKRKYAEVKKIKSFENYFGNNYYVDNCPLAIRSWQSGRRKGLTYARPDDCRKCSLCICDFDSFNSSEIYCLGHLKNNFQNILWQESKQLRSTQE